MKLIEQLNYNEFENYQYEIEQTVLKTKGVAKIDFSDLDEEIPYSGGILRREIFGISKTGLTLIKVNLLYRIEPDNIVKIYVY